jgi:very-short-patch-repair endonuclease
LAGWLADQGLVVIAQQAIGRYNVDLAVWPVAMEVLGGNWHSRKPGHGKRTETILNQGWHLVLVWDIDPWPITPVTTEHVITLLKKTSRNPTMTREYRVIRGDGQLIARGTPQNNPLTYIPSSRSRRSLPNHGGT